MPLLFAAIAAVVGWGIGRGTRNNKVVSGAEALAWIPPDPLTGMPGYWARKPASATQQSQSPVAILMQLVSQRMPVSPGLAQAAYQEAMRSGDAVIAQQIAVVFFGPPQQQFAPPPPIMVGEETEEALQAEYGDMEPAKATSTTIHHGTQPPSVSDVSPEEWRSFVLCFKTREPSYRGDRHFGAFEQSTRRASQLGIDPNSLTTEEAQYQALDKDLTNYLQSSERLLNDFTGESVSINGEKVTVTRSGVLALLKAAGPAGAKGWLTEEHQRKAFPNTTEIFTKGNGRF